MDDLTRPVNPDNGEGNPDAGKDGRLGEHQGKHRDDLARAVEALVEESRSARRWSAIKAVTNVGLFISDLFGE